MGTWEDRTDLKGAVYVDTHRSIWVLGLRINPQSRVMGAIRYYASGISQPADMFGPYETLDEAKDTAEMLYHNGLIV